MSAAARQKPAVGAVLDRACPLVAGLRWFAPCWANGGSSLSDVVGGGALAVSSSASWVAGGSPLAGGGLSFGSGSAYAQVALPPALWLQAPLTLVLGYRCGGAAASNGFVFGLYLNDSAGSPYASAAVGYASATTLQMSGAWTSGEEEFVGPRRIVGAGGGPSSGYAQSGGLFTPVVGVDYVLVACFGVAAYSFFAFPVSGGLPVSASGSWGHSLNASYGSTATLGLGSAAGYSRDPACVVYFAGIYDRALSAVEASALGADPWRLFGSGLGASMMYGDPGVNSGSAGVNLGGIAVASFGDSPPPSVLAVLPAAGETSSTRVGAISAVFDLALDPATASGSTVSLSSAAGAVDAVVSYDASSQAIVLRPLGLLTAATAYTVTLSTGIESLAGVPLAASYSWSFTTSGSRRPRWFAGLKVARPTGLRHRGFGAHG